MSSENESGPTVVASSLGFLESEVSKEELEINLGVSEKIEKWTRKKKEKKERKEKKEKKERKGGREKREKRGGRRKRKGG